VVDKPTVLKLPSRATLTQCVQVHSWLMSSQLLCYVLELCDKESWLSCVISCVKSARCAPTGTVFSIWCGAGAFCLLFVTCAAHLEVNCKRWQMTFISFLLHRPANRGQSVCADKSGRCPLVFNFRRTQLSVHIFTLSILSHYMFRPNHRPSSGAIHEYNMFWKATNFQRIRWFFKNYDIVYICTT
jgi:hypothetical protein